MDFTTVLVLIVALGLFAGAAWLGVKFQTNYAKPARSEIERARKAVEAIPDHRGALSNFHEIDDTLSNLPLVHHQWRKFKERLIFPQSGQPDPIKNTARPSDFLNLAAVDGQRLPLKFYFTLPGYFVGGGLLTTFIGLVVALFFASASVGAENIQVAKAALQNLLHAATFKFASSIAGLGSSLVLSFYLRWQSEELSKSLNLLCRALEERLFFAPTEEVAFRQLKVQEDHTRQLEGFNTDFAFTIGKAFETALEGSMPRHIQTGMAPLKESMDNFAANVGQMNMSAMKDMADNFGQTLQQSAGKEMRAIAETLQGIQSQMSNTGTDFSERIAKATERLESTMSGIGAELRSISKSVEESISGAKGVLEDELTSTMQNLTKSAEFIGSHLISASREMQATTSAAATKFGEEIGKSGEAIQSTLAPTIDRLSKALVQFDGSIGKQAAMFDEVAIKTNAAAVTIEDTSEAMKEIAAPLIQVAREIGGAVESMRAATSQASSSILGTQKRMEELASELQETLQTLQSSWSGYEERFANVDESLEKALKGLMTGVDQSVRAVGSYVQAIDQEMGKAVNHLSGGIQELTEAMEEAAGKFNGATSANA